MRNHGPGKWREWRWGDSYVVPLYEDRTKEPNDRDFTEVAHQTVRALTAKNELKRLKDRLDELLERPSSPNGRVPEARFREVLRDAASGVLAATELERIFPPAPPPRSNSPELSPSDEERRSSRPGLGTRSKSGRQFGTSKSVLSRDSAGGADDEDGADPAPKKFDPLKEKPEESADAPGILAPEPKAGSGADLGFRPAPS